MRRSWFLPAAVAVLLVACSSSDGGASPSTAAEGSAPPSSTIQAATTGVLGAALDPVLVDQLEAALDDAFATADVPGAIVGVWIPGQGEWVSRRGVADLDTGAPMERGNQQKIGSVAKEFMGTVALQVMADHPDELSLDSTIDRWYPDIPLASDITVRMLLNMSSGLGSSPQAQVDRICADPYATPTPDEVISTNMEFPRATFAPGEGFDDANVNFYVLGRILEQVTGTDVETLIGDGITGPLGMPRSRFAADGQLAAPFARGYTWYCPNLPPATDTTDWPGAEEWAGGAMVSTLDDLHTWGDAMRTGELVTAEQRAAQLDDGNPTGPAGATYGLGVQIVRDIDTHCVTILEHAGSEPGYQSDVIAFPTSGATMVILGNGNGYEVDFNIIFRTLYPLLTDLLVVPPTEPCPASSVPAPDDVPADVPDNSPAPVSATPAVPVSTSVRITN